MLDSLQEIFFLRLHFFTNILSFATIVYLAVLLLTSFFRLCSDSDNICKKFTNESNRWIRIENFQTMISINYCYDSVL